MTSTEYTNNPNEREPVVKPHYERLPFCNPEAPHESASEIIYNFDPGEGATHRILRAEAARLYEIEKSGELYGEDDGQGLDLYKKDHANGLSHHVMVHSATGMLRWGTSDTPNIPYWDRQFAVEALRLQHPEDDQRVEVLDALNINYLRSYNAYLAEKTDELTQDKDTLEAALTKGQRTRRDISSKQAEELDVVRKEHATFTHLFVAKLKHLIWLTDQQENPEVREHLLPEIIGLIDRGEKEGVTADMLGVDMGVDTGISEDTYRPAYVITGFKQLRHLGTDTYALPQSICHQLSLADMVSSISRPETGLPAYEDGRYRLPWRLDE